MRGQFRLISRRYYCLGCNLLRNLFFLSTRFVFNLCSPCFFSFNVPSFRSIIVRCMAVFFFFSVISWKVVFVSLKLLLLVFFFFLAEGWDTIVHADIFENVNGGFRNRSSV